MTNCCDAWGDCQQSDTCPARTGTVLPHQAAHAARVAKIKSTRPGWMDGRATPARTCDELGVCQGKGDCACTHPVAALVGAFKIIDLGPDDSDDGQPLTHDENMQLVRTLLLWLLAVVSVVVLVSVGVGYSTERWAEVVWAYLARLS